MEFEKGEENRIFNEILLKLKKQGYTQYENYNKFEYEEETTVAIFLKREKGTEVRISKEDLKLVIKEFIKDPKLYFGGPSSLRDLGITHVNSPVHSLLHLLPKSSYYESN